MTDQTEFKITPDANELANLQRDLRFHPSCNPAPKQLSLAQVDEFNQKGHLGPFPFLDQQQVLDLRDYFDTLLERQLAAGKDSYSISSAHLKHRRVHELLCDPAIIAIANDLLGDNVIGWGAHFFCKLPGDGKRVDWHQDASYWPLTPSKAITIWLAIDDADIENACMRFVSGSHHFGHLTYRPSSADAHNVLDQSVENPHQYGDEYINEVPAGSFSVHSDLLLHGSAENTSTRRRCALTLRYCAADVRAGLGWNQKGVWVSGTDPSGHWSNHRSPVQPDADN